MPTPTYEERYHADLPRAFFTNRDGTPITKVRTVKSLHEGEIEMVRSIRDRILDLYFPPSVINSWGETEDDRGWLGISTTRTDSYGDAIGTRTYKPGSTREFEVPARGGGTRIQRIKTPYVIVPEDTRGKTSIIDGKEVRWGVWERSYNAWMSHLMGMDSMLAFWDSRRGDDLTCILLDIDTGDDHDPSDEIGDYIAPWVAAVESIESHHGVDLGVNWMVSGSKGCWLQIFLDSSVDRSDAAALIVAITSVVVSSGHSVRLSSQTIKHFDDIDTIHELGIVTDRDVQVTYSADDGNIGNRNCRVPFARHHRTGRISHFVNPDGSDVDSQLSHMFSIRRISAESVRIIARAVRDASIVQEDRVLDEQPIQNTEMTATPPATTTPYGRKEGKGSRPEIPVHIVPGTRGQRFHLLDDILSLDTSGITGDEELNDIVPMMFGAAYDTLFTEGRLMLLYDWISARGDEITEELVVDILMTRYVGRDRDQRRRRFTTMVRSDISRNRHSRSMMSRRTMAIRAAELAADAGLRSVKTIRILQSLCLQSSKGGVITATSELLARIAGVIEPDETDVAKIRAAKVNVGDRLKTLVEMGIIDRISTGHPNVPSEFSITILNAHTDAQDGSGSTISDQDDL